MTNEYLTNEYCSKHREEFSNLTRYGQQLTIKTLRDYVAELESVAMGFTCFKKSDIGENISAMVHPDLDVEVLFPGGSSVVFDVSEQRDLLPLLVAVDKERKFRNGEWS